MNNSSHYQVELRILGEPNSWVKISWGLRSYLVYAIHGSYSL